MAVLVPFLGRHVTSVTADLLDVDASGNLTTNAQALLTLTGVIDELSYNGRVLTEPINTLTASYENEVVVEQADYFTMSEILGPDDTDAAMSFLPRLWQVGGASAANASQYVTFTLVRGTTAATDTITFTALLQEYTEIIRHGKLVARLSIQMVDSNTANPTYG